MLRSIQGIRQGRSSKRRRGSAAVEAALILPIILVLTVGGIDISQYVNLAQIVTDSSRQGARVACRNGTGTVGEVEDAVMDYLAGSFPQLSDTQLEDAVAVEVLHSDGSAITNGDLTTVPSGDAISIRVSFDFDDIRWFSGPDYWNGNVNESTTFCRRE